RTAISSCRDSGREKVTPGNASRQRRAIVQTAWRADAELRRISAFARKAQARIIVDLRRRPSAKLISRLRACLQSASRVAKQPPGRVGRPTGPAAPGRPVQVTHRKTFEEDGGVRNASPSRDEQQGRR